MQCILGDLCVQNDRWLCWGLIALTVGSTLWSQQCLQRGRGVSSAEEGVATVLTNPNHISFGPMLKGTEFPSFTERMGKCLSPHFAHISDGMAQMLGFITLAECKWLDASWGWRGCFYPGGIFVYFILYLNCLWFGKCLWCLCYFPSEGIMCTYFPPKMNDNKIEWFPSTTTNVQCPPWWCMAAI